MVSTLRHTEPRHPRFGLRLRRKAFSCRLWDAIQAAIGSEDRRSVDSRQVTYFYLMRLHKHRGMPAEAVAQLEKAAALSPELNPMALLVHACAISRPEREGSEDSEPVRNSGKKESSVSSYQFALICVAPGDKEKGLAGPRKSLSGAMHLAHLQQDGSQIRSPPLRCALHRYPAAHRATAVSFAAA
jgi:hypothetical protein